MGKLDALYGKPGGVPEPLPRAKVKEDRGSAGKHQGDAGKRQGRRAGKIHAAGATVEKLWSQFGKKWKEQCLG